MHLEVLHLHLGKTLTLPSTGAVSRSSRLHSTCSVPRRGYPSITGLLWPIPVRTDDLLRHVSNARPGDQNGFYN